MAEAVRVYVRYEIPDENGETRRQRNIRVGEYTPSFILPKEGKYIWEWFVSLNESVTRISEGSCKRIPPSEYLAWVELTGNIVYPWEYDIMVAMDNAFCDETNKEFQNLRSKQEEEQARQVEEARKRRR